MKIISWNATRRCDLNCLHCYRDAGEEASRELTTGEGKKLLDEIKKCGFQIMVFSGGEPLMREDIFDLIAYSSQIGLRPVLGTSGTMITPEVARKLKRAGALRLGISLDSVHPEVHDNFRQTPGSFDKAMKGMENCKAEGLEFQIHTTIVKQNQQEFEAIADLAVELGAEAHHIFFLVPTGRGEAIEDEALGRKAYEAQLQKIMEKQKQLDIELKPTCAPQFMRIAATKDMPLRFTRGCLAGTSYCCITPVGDVNPCPYLPLKVGNVLDMPFDKIWQESEIFTRMRTLEIGGKCSKCEYLDICSGCRARAYYYHGDYMAEDPWCLYQPGEKSKGTGEDMSSGISMG